MQIKQKKGFVSIVMIVFIMAAMTSVSLGMYAILRYQQKIEYTKRQSVQAYYTAEAGIEDAVLRLIKEKNLPNSYSFAIGQSSTTISVLEISTTTKRIVSDGFSNDRYRTLMIDIFNDSATTTSASFNVGGASGLGGFDLQNSSGVIGDITANGSITMANTATINGNVQIALNSNDIDGLGVINGDLFVNTCNNNIIVNGVLHVNTNNGCVAASEVPLGAEIAATPLAITATDISDWKTEALAGGVHSGDWTAKTGIYYLGPKKIDGNLLIRNTATVYITGSVWVTGTVIFRNTAIIRLDTSYGNSSGAIVADGVMTLEGEASAYGSGNPKSFMILVSDLDNTTGNGVVVDNTFGTDIIAAPRSWVEITNSTNIKHVSAYGVRLINGAVLTYDPNMDFLSTASGGGGTIASSSWSLYTWEEVD